MIPSARPVREFEGLLTGLAAGGELVHLEIVAARTARHAQLATSVPFDFELYTHQASAIELVRSGQSIVVATGTASGKSLCYQVPIVESVKAGGTALLLFPTKALAQDQLRAVGAYDGVVPVTYDGDSTVEARTWARRHASVVLTNPDMLHAGILPFHGRWGTFFRRLRHVVIDELHVYRGTFGSHVAHVLRRLRRVCALYGSAPTFILTSATIGDPGGLAATLIGSPVETVSDDASPAGERVMAVWRPQASRDGKPVSGNMASAVLLAALVRAGHRSIAFTRSRRAAELVAAGAKRHVGTALAARIRSYRGGYLATERREIEAQLFNGDLLGVSATNALELGVDIGGLDACIVNGFPGTVASFRQQIGRSGRGAQRSLAVLVAGDDALDQWYATHPDQLVTRAPEPVVVNIANPFTLEPHIGCAAYEIPLVPADAGIWEPDTFDDCVAQMVADDQLVLVNGRAVWAGRGSPSSRVGLRTGGANREVRIVGANDDRLLGTVDAERALSSVHAGALYLHQGEQYRVLTLDLQDRVAWVERSDADEYTQARTVGDIRIIHAEAETLLGTLSTTLGRVEVHEQVVGYERRRVTTGAVLGREPLDLPSSVLATRAFWFTVDDRLLERAGMDGPGALRIPGTVHAAEHSAIGMLPLFTICDRWDVGGVSTALHEQTGAATIFIFDAYPGGAGIAELGYANASALLRETAAAIGRCPCRDGCPSCVQSPKCGNGNDPLDKAGALTLLGFIT